jgi:AbrB family looped-hinge helix DNA binding protein
MATAHPISIRVAEGGRIVIPADIRKQCGLEVGTDVIVAVEDDHVTLRSASAAIQKAQAIVARHVPRGISLSRELLAERKREARRE